MKFTIKKKLNLSRIDKELWPYEDEVYEAIEADSFEEAQRIVDVYYAEREGYYRAKSEAFKAEANKKNDATLPLPNPLPNNMASNPTTPNQVPVAPNVNPASNPVESNQVDSGVSNQAPKAFN